MAQRKVILITGSGKKRIGNVIALEAAARGYDVAVHYHSSKDDAAETLAQLKAKGARAAAFAANVAEESEIKKMFSGVLAEFGRLDVLVTCASIWSPKTLEATTAEDLNENFAVNTLGTFICAQSAGEIMVKQSEGGAIITLGDWAIARPYINYAAYFISKGSIPTMTALLANELARRNPKVRVNCVHPGPAMVPDSVTDEERMKIVSRTPARSLGNPEQIAQAVFFFAENEYVTGTSLPVDGGRTIASPE